MLGKLIKYEWKATWKMLVPMDAFIVLMSILAYIMLSMSFFDSDNGVVIMSGIAVFFTYVLSLAVIAIGTIIYLIHRFYTSVYGDEGYLLHTLPVDKHHIIIAKMIMSAVWIIINIGLIYFSVLLAFYADLETTGLIEFSFDMYMDLATDFGEIGGFGILMTCVAAFFALFARILKVLACISLGQLAANHKVLASFAFYGGMYFVQKLFSIFFLMILVLLERATDFSDFITLSGGWEITLISSLIYCALFYFLTWYMMDRKLNLD